MNPISELDLPSFAGRWVARVRGKVIAQGRTREEALRAAKISRPKEKPEVSFMVPPSTEKKEALLRSILAGVAAGQTIHLVGGAVRDRLLGRQSDDLDFAVPEGALSLARRIANRTHGAFFPLDEGSDTGRIVYVHEDGSRTRADFAAYRRPDLAADLGARDFTINAMALDLRTNETLDPLGGLKDLREKRIRACSPQSFTDDPVRILRAVRQAASLGFSIQLETRRLMKDAAPLLSRVSPERLRDELLKMLGGKRPATSLRALELLGALPYLLPELPALKGVSQPAPHVHDVWAHTLAVVGHLEVILAALEPGQPPGVVPGERHAGGMTPPVRTPGEETDLFEGLISLRLGRYREHFAAHFAPDPASERTPRSLLFFAALYHDIAKPQTRALHEGRIRFWGHDELGARVAGERARALRLSNDDISRVRAIVAHHMRLHFFTNRLAAKKSPPSRRAIYRFFRDAREAGVDLCLLGLADLRGTYEQTLPQEIWTACLDVCRILLENWWEKPQETVSPPGLVNGHDLITSLGLAPGPTIGKLLEAVQEAQATGVLPPGATREDALGFAQGWLAEAGNR
jgi:putative nucleotidyltransferase with HDIG domain